MSIKHFKFKPTSFGRIEGRVDGFVPGLKAGKLATDALWIAHPINETWDLYLPCTLLLN